MKYKLIAGAIASVLTIGGLSVLPFKEVNIDPQIESINNSTNIVSKAKDVIEKLGNNVTELSNKNKDLVIENENLKEEINNGSGNSEMNYKNPSNNPDVILGKAGGEKFKSFIGTNLGGTNNIYYTLVTVEYYYKIKCAKQFIAFYNYMIDNDICYKSKNELQNIIEQNRGLSSINHNVYNTIQGQGYGETFYYYLNIVIKNKKPVVLPENERKALENISLAPELQSKLNECFSLFLNYCKNNDLKNGDTNGLNNLRNTYSQLMKDQYLKEFFSYLCNNPEVSNSISKYYLNEYTKSYDANLKRFETQTDNFIEEYKNKK